MLDNWLRTKAGHYKPFTEIERIAAFARKVDKRSHYECWNWLAGRFSSGYGCFGHSPAHRVSWELFYGPIPDDILVLHKCNNKLCVNPYHLYLGDMTDNARDSIRAGTFGPLHRGKLSGDDVIVIKKLLSQGVSQKKIADEFNVCQYTIFSINKGIPSYAK